MKIGIDASRYSHETATGVEWYSYQIINGIISESLKQEDCEIVLYSSKNIPIPEEFEGLKRIRKRIMPMKRFWTLLRLSKEIRENPPDVLFIPSHTLPLCHPRFSVITIHDVAFKYLPKSYSIIAKWYLNWSTKFASKKASRIIVPSESTKKDLIEFFDCSPHKIEVIHHGFKSHRKSAHYVPKHKIDSPYIFSIGRIESKKNLTRLIEAFKNFSESRPEYKLVLAGKEGFGSKEIFAKVKELSLGNKVVFTGYVDEDEKSCLYENCEFFVFPSFYEGFGYPLLEAFHYGKPILTSHVSCLPEIAGDAALYFDPFDTATIVQALEKISSNKDLRADLIQKGTERLKHFSLQDSVKKTFDILTK